MLQDNDLALLQLLFYQSRIIPFCDTYPLLNIEIHNFKLAMTLTIIVKNSDNCTKYCIRCCHLLNSSLFNEFVCNLGLFCFFLTSEPFLNASETIVLKAHECQKRPNLHTNELNTTFFCSTCPLKAPNRLKSLKSA
jgi:hypothetical protein